MTYNDIKSSPNHKALIWAVSFKGGKLKSKKTVVTLNLDKTPYAIGYESNGYLIYADEVREKEMDTEVLVKEIYYEYGELDMTVLTESRERAIQAILQQVEQDADKLLAHTRQLKKMLEKF